MGNSEKIEDEVSLKEWKETLNGMTHAERQREAELSAILKADLISGVTSLSQVLNSIMSSVDSDEDLTSPPIDSKNPQAKSDEHSALLPAGDDDHKAEPISTGGNNIYSIKSRYNFSVSITAQNKQFFLSFKKQLEDTVSTYKGGIWALIESAIANGIDWPAWWPAYTADVKKYRAALGGNRFCAIPTFLLTQLSERRYGEGMTYVKP